LSVLPYLTLTGSRKFLDPANAARLLNLAAMKRV
jgi:hypothetical protein